MCAQSNSEADGLPTCTCRGLGGGRGWVGGGGGVRGA